jgi:GTPase SAR1 family protein
MEVDKKSVPYSCLVKLVAAGDYGAGKSSLLVRYIKDTYHPQYRQTIGSDYHNVDVDVDGNVVRVLPPRPPRLITCI